jgi:hypothetical protein
MRAPKPQLASEVKYEGQEWENAQLAIPWDCELYTQEEFIGYYGGVSEFVQCQEITDTIIDCMVFLLQETGHLTVHELRLVMCLKLLCCRNKGASMLELNADEELLILARSVYAPLWYRISYLRFFGMPDDTILARHVGEEIMNRWKKDEMSNSSKEHRGRLRGAFWAQVHRLVGSTHVAKCLINYGLSNIDSLSYVLHEVVESKKTDVHRNLVTINELPLTENEKRLRTDAKWFTSKCKKARRRLEESGSQSSSHMDWLEEQCARYEAMRLGRKRKLQDLTGNAMHEAGLLDVYESIE